MERYAYSAQARAALESLQQPLAVYQYIDKRPVALLVSDGFCSLFGFTDHEQATYAMNHVMFDNAHPDDRNRMRDAVYRFAEAEDDVPLDIVYRTRSGVSADYRVIHLRGKHQYSDTGIRLSHVWYMDEGIYVEGTEDIGTQINRTLNGALHEESILNAARYDELTGLPNLAWFFKLAEYRKGLILGEGKQGVLLYMDLNGMKYFNHRYGFAEGDRLLVAFARLLESVFGRENCCHITADRFAVATYEETLGERMDRLFSEAGKLNGGKTLPIRAGVYSTAIEDVPASMAYDRSKMACDTIGPSDQSAYSYYSKEVRDAVRRHQYVIANIDRAISEGWIRVYYQAIVRAVNEQICDMEALARWIDPSEGFLSPADFIPQLENAGLIYKLDLCVLEQVLKKLQGQLAAGENIVPHSVNLSRSDFDACDIVEEIRKRVDDAGIPREMITIEITESVIGSDFEFMKAQVARFREMGFPVWMDDFGNGYSSLDVLQSLRFDLIKFDMSFMRKLDEGDSGKIILTELMKMATMLGVDTVCEGVETLSQASFLQEIGCSKLQGFYFSKPIPPEKIPEIQCAGKEISFEDPDTAAYFETIGRVNLYDVGVIAHSEDGSFQHAFNTLPMAIIEIKDDQVRYTRTNPSYRLFIKRFFGFDMTSVTKRYAKFSSAFMKNIQQTCCEQGGRSFFNEKMPDGSIVHSFARRISNNPVNGVTAVALAVLSISEPSDGENYADIARALAADYYNIYVVDLDTEDFIEYSSSVGRDNLAVERHGRKFFESARRDTMIRIYEEDRELFLNWFTKRNVVRALDEQGVFTTTYRLIDTGSPMYVNMKITRMPGTQRIILGVSIIDAQMKKREKQERKRVKKTRREP